MTKAEDKRLEELEAELTKTRNERDTYLASAQTMDRMSKKLLDLDDSRQTIGELVQRVREQESQIQQMQQHTHPDFGEEPESGEEA